MVLDRDYAHFREHSPSSWCADSHEWSRTPKFRTPSPKAYRASTPSKRTSRMSSPKRAWKVSSCAFVFRELHAGLVLLRLNTALGVLLRNDWLATFG
jgi:hypothetical protein